MLRNRLIFGTLMIAALVALLWADHWLDRRDTGLPPGTLFALLVALLAVAGAAELAVMQRQKHLMPLTMTSAAVAAALALSPWLGLLLPRLQPLPLWVLGLGVPALFLAQCVARKVDNAIANLSASLLIVGYIGVGGMFAVMLRTSFGTWGLLLFVAAVKTTDIGGYTFGKLLGLGKHKLAPWLSPGKSWEGLAGGMLFAVAASVAIGLAAGVLGWWQAIVFGLVMAPLGQAADMAESLLKRDAVLKDSGGTVPGFGGVLDVLDSPLGAAAFGYLMLILLTGAA